MEYKYELKVWSEDTDDLIYSDSAFSMDSLVDKSYKIDGAIKKYEAKNYESNTE